MPEAEVEIEHDKRGGRARDPLRTRSEPRKRRSLDDGTRNSSAKGKWKRPPQRQPRRAERDQRRGDHHQQNVLQHVSPEPIICHAFERGVERDDERQQRGRERESAPRKRLAAPAADDVQLRLRRSAPVPRARDKDCSENPRLTQEIHSCYAAERRRTSRATRSAANGKR